MINFSGFSLKVKHFKCFGDPEQGFDDIKPLNLIIGRNNSGKSSLLELIDYAVRGTIVSDKSQWHSNQRPFFIAEAPLTKEELKIVFPMNTSRGGIPGANHWEFGQKLVGTRLRWSFGDGSNKNTFLAIGNSVDGSRPLEDLDFSDRYLQQITVHKQNPFIGKEFCRIFAERNIVPEKHAHNIEVDGHGKGVTNTESVNDFETSTILI